MEYTTDTPSVPTTSGIIPVEDTSILDQLPLETIPQKIDDDSDIEFFECIHCGKFNAISSTPFKRRETRTRHIKVNDVTWGSIRRFAIVHNITMDQALMRLLYGAQTKDFQTLVTPKKTAKRQERKENKRTIS